MLQFSIVDTDFFNLLVICYKLTSCRSLLLLLLLISFLHDVCYCRLVGKYFRFSGLVLVGLLCNRYDEIMLLFMLNKT